MSTKVTYTHTLANGTTADAGDVMDDLNDIKNFCEKSTDGTMAGASATAMVTESAVITYVAANSGSSLTTDLNVNEYGIVLDPAISADGKFSGIVEAGTAGTTLAFGDLCYYAVADSRWELTDANAQATAFGKLGICVLAAAANGSATIMLLYGKVNGATAFPDLTIGAPVFVSTTAGDVQMTAPSGAADIVRIVGYGNSSDELFFCPSPDFFEHV
jgi:hypothetical protein